MGGAVPLGGDAGGVPAGQAGQVRARGQSCGRPGLSCSSHDPPGLVGMLSTLLRSVLPGNDSKLAGRPGCACGSLQGGRRRRRAHPRLVRPAAAAAEGPGGFHGLAQVGVLGGWWVYEMEMRICECSMGWLVAMVVVVVVGAGAAGPSASLVGQSSACCRSHSRSAQPNRQLWLSALRPGMWWGLPSRLWASATTPLPPTYGAAG